MKKVLSAIIIVTLVFGCMSTISNDAYGKSKKWKTYLGLNKGWFEGAGGKIYTNRKGFTANLSKQIGWGGVWGGYAQYKYKFKKGRYYSISFKIKSTKHKKFVYITARDKKGKKINFGKWIDCKKNKWIRVQKVFKAKYNCKYLSFGFGGDYGDRRKEDDDPDTKYRYKRAPKKGLDSRLGKDSSVYRTKIKVKKLKIKKL